MEPLDMYEPVAIVGFSFKFPGEADSLEGFWDTIIEGRCVATALPRDRLDLSGVYHPDETRHDTVNVRDGHFLRGDVTAFDAPFFSISSTEAATMDPQQRLLLETTYHALENAGIPIHKVTNTRTSVFTGSFTDDYKTLYTKDLDHPGSYSATGITTTLNSNRISWFFNLLGNSITIDSACSSSLVGLDLACKSLHSRDSDMGVVTGVNMMLAADLFYVLSDMNMLSPDGRCWSFDERGNGYGRGEGAAVLIVKRLSDAIRDGNTIRAVIRSTGSNSDGRTPGITQPKQSSQEALIRDCYQKAGLDVSRTGYFEAHGTGTPVGDPVEANALGAAFRSRDNEEPLYIGAVKSNIGHLEGASGIAGVIKAILVLERGLIPPVANLNKLNPRIDEELLRLKFPRQLEVWPKPGLRRASINSFGFGGTNSHVVLDDSLNFLREHGLDGVHCTTPEPTKASPVLGSTLTARTGDSSIERYLNGSSFKTLVFSAADEAAISRMSSDYSDHLSKVKSNLSENHFRRYLENLAFTLNTRRSILPWKAHVTIDIDKLDVQGFTASVTRPVRSSIKPRVAFIFTGQGAQWATMGKTLSVYTAFSSSLQNAQAILQSFGSTWNLNDEIAQPQHLSRINHPEFSQPICTALQLALVDLLRVCGVFPEAVIGHSSGEIAAAYSIGAISAKAALKIAYARGTCASTIRNGASAKGAMMSVGLSASKARSYLHDVTRPFGSLVIACYNGPRNVTISGPETSIDILKHTLDEDKVFARKLLVDVAYHSPCMAEVAEQYAETMADLDFGDLQPTSDSMFSTVSGQKVEFDRLRTPSYWVDNLVSPVLFTTAFEHISSKNVAKKVDGSHTKHVKVDVCMEIGPHSALRGQVRDMLIESSQEDSIRYLAVLERHGNDLATYLGALGQLDCCGYPIDWMQSNHPGLSTNDLVPLCDLPEYSFDHSKSYWHESKISRESRLQTNPKLDLLGKRAPDWNQHAARWRHFLRLAESPWVEDHKVNGTIILPGAAMLVMAIEALKQLATPTTSVRGFELHDVAIHTALVVPSDGVQIQVHVYQDQDVGKRDMSWKIFALIGEEWTECCHGSGRVDYATKTSEIDNGTEEIELLRKYQLQHARDRQHHTTQVDSREMYSHLAEFGYEFGNAFQPLRDAHCSETGASADIQCYRWTDESGVNHPQEHVIHPCTLDGFLQLPMVAMSKGGTKPIKTLVPTSIRRFWIAVDGLSWPRCESLPAVARILAEDNRGIEACSSAIINDGSLLGVTMEGVRFTYIAGQADESDVSEQNTLWNLQWEPDIDLLHDTDLENLCVAESRRTAEPVEFYQKLTFLLYTFLDTTTRQLSTMDIKPTQPHFLKYLAWAQMQMQKNRSRQAPGKNSSYECMALDESYVHSTLAEIQDTNAQATSFLTVGNNLLEILCGKIDILALLFHTNIMHAHYEEISTFSAFDSLDRYLNAFSYKYPNARYLEAGAGTGGSTLRILQSLLHHQDPKTAPHMYRDYTFTDISEAFFEKAKLRLKDYPDISYKRFDIEKSASAQGFELASYDCIVAANVVHATASLGTTLQNLHALLRPGGKLVLYEITNPTILRNGFIGGLLPGWWLSTEDYRSSGHGPCLEPDQWNRVLIEHGFSGVDVTLRDFKSDDCYEMSILISTKVVAPAATKDDPKVTVITAANDSASTDVGPWTAALGASGLPSHFVSLQDLVKSEEITSDICVILDDTKQPLLRSMGDSELGNLKQLLVSSSTIIWVSQSGDAIMHPDFALVQGFTRVLRRELEDTKIVTVSLNGLNTLSSEKCRQIIDIAIKSYHSDAASYEREFEDRDGRMHICRLTASTGATLHVQELASEAVRRDVSWDNGTALKLVAETPGLLDSLHFVEDEDHLRPLEADEVEIKVHAVGMNFKDCLIALGQVNGQGIGNECAGVVTRAGSECSLQPGERVYMFTFYAFKTYARSKVPYVHRLPDSMSFVEGAAVPTQFMTAWTCLVEIAHLEKGESVLIHAAAGGTGQAAVQISQHIGAEIFVTVSSIEKKRLLIEQYGLQEDHVLYSRDTSFALGINRLTKGRGVDVVLNSLAGDSLIQSWNCLASCGRFVEMGKRDILQNASLPMLPFNQSATFSAFDAAVWGPKRPEKMRQVSKTTLDLFTQGVFRTATPLHLFSVSEVKKVFRFLADGKSAGKIVLQMTEDAIVPTLLKPRSIYQLQPDKTYVIAGGLGGVGRSIARWMVDRGARHLILLSRSGAKIDTAKTFVQELEAVGARVKTPPIDISDRSALATTLEDCLHNMPPIKGCVQASMVLCDGLFKDMTIEQWEGATKSKVEGSWNLHELLPPQMDFFICLSSMSGIYGLPAQSNYAAGNTYLDALAHYRVGHGEKAVSVNLGAVLSDGYLAENTDVLNRLLNAGCMQPVTRSEVHGLLEYYCNPQRAVLRSQEAQVIIGLNPPQRILAEGHDVPEWLHEPPYRVMQRIPSGQRNVDGESSLLATSHDFRTEFVQAESVVEAGNVAARALVARLARTLSSVHRDTVNLDWSTQSFGVDSLLAIELRSWIMREFLADVPVFGIIGGATFTSIGVTIANKSLLRREGS